MFVVNSGLTGGRLGISGAAPKIGESGFVLYVNGDPDLPNTVKDNGEEKTIKIRSIEADFNRLMFFIRPLKVQIDNGRVGL